MSVSIKCDKCGTKISSDCVVLRSEFATVQNDMLVRCAPADKFELCDKCYEKLVKNIMIRDNDKEL